jgi:phage/plasmid primase-like uncharacterized protein/RecA-family ATPase
MQATMEQRVTANPTALFAQEMQGAGYKISGDPIADGELHRFPCGDRSGDQAGWYILYGEGIPAGSFGDWRTGKTYTWCAKHDQELTPQDRDEYRRRIEYQKRLREVEEKSRQNKGAERAREMWDAAKPADAGHPYLLKKQIEPLGVRQDDAGRLLVPLRDIVGDMTSVQTIDADGRKLFLKGSRKRSCFFTIQGDGDTYYISEGFATGASIHQASGGTVFVAFDAGNLLPVSKAIRERNPEAKITICGDNDLWTEGNPGAAKATEAAQAIGATVVLPFFKSIVSHPTDFNDLAVSEGLEAVKVQLNRKPESLVPTLESLQISSDEWESATLSPDCIVQSLLYADVAIIAAPGGTGKTTQCLYEGVHVALKKRLYGFDVIKSGWSLFVTSEDTRQILIARLREIVKSMGLSQQEMEVVRRSVVFWDVSSGNAKLLSMNDGNIVLTPIADAIVDTFKDNPPVLVTLDPIVSFGVGESRINDNEQALIMAARRIRNGLNCCVQMITHTGKQNGREKTLDQYTSRGGSALPDGSRMVRVLQSWDHRDSKYRPPQGCNPEPGSSITIMARPKLSYAKPNLPLIWIKRTGWTFEYFTEQFVTDEQRERGRLDQIERFIASEEHRGVYHTKTSLETQYEKIGILRKDGRSAVEMLIAECRVINKDLPKEHQQGGRKTYLSVRQKTAGSGGVAKNEQNTPPKNNRPTTLPPYREKNGGGVEPPVLSQFPKLRRDTSAGFGGVGGVEQKNTTMTIQDDEVLI